MLLMYCLSCFDLFDKFKELDCYYSISSLYETMKKKVPSIFITLEAIFTCITWEERGYISISLTEGYEIYTEEEAS